MHQRPSQRMPQCPLGQAWQQAFTHHTHLICRLPGSATPRPHLAAGAGGRGSGKEPHSTAAYLQPWQGLGILLCLSSQDYVHEHHLTLPASHKCSQQREQGRREAKESGTLRPAPGPVPRDGGPAAAGGQGRWEAANREGEWGWEGREGP